MIDSCRSPKAQIALAVLRSHKDPKVAESIFRESGKPRKRKRAKSKGRERPWPA